MGQDDHARASGRLSGVGEEVIVGRSVIVGTGLGVTSFVDVSPGGMGELELPWAFTAGTVGEGGGVVAAPQATNTRLPITKPEI
jgi:hypothetical protein